jgi:glycerol kinase
MKFQADVLGVPVVVPEVSETTALGAAYLAGVATGTWSEDDVRSMWRAAARYEPSMSDEAREELLSGWERAVARARSNEGDRSG